MAKGSFKTVGKGKRRFVPHPEPEDDEEVELEDDDAVENGAGGEQARTKKKRRRSLVDDAAEEDDDGEEEEDEAQPRKRNRFIDDIAAVDEDEDEEEDDEDVDDLIHDEAEEVAQAEDVLRTHRQVDLRERRDLTNEDVERYVKERYEEPALRERQHRDDSGAQAGVVGQQALLPNHTDPKLWLVHTKPGAEREAVQCLLQKGVDLALRGVPLQIKSAFAQDHLKGYIYVEAFKEAHVKEAMRGLRIFFQSKGAQLVPLREMVDAITVNAKARAAIDVGAWARVRAGLYKGDLAKVVDVDHSAGRALVRLVPRLDYAALAQRREEGRTPGLPFGQAPAVRPPARAFSETEAKEHRLLVEKKRSAEGGGFYYLLNGSQRFEDGYLVKPVAVKSLVLEEALPPLDELQRYNQVGAAARAEGDASAGGELAQLVESLATDGDAAAVAALRFSKDDKVRVVEGDLKELLGRVRAVLEDGRVEVMPSLKDLDEVLTFEPGQLAKYFQTGDHVRVAGGQHEGQTGMVVRVEGAACVLVSDAAKVELRVFARDLSEAAAAASGPDTFGEYELHNLVALDGPQTVGVLVNVSKDTARVLTNQGTAEQPDVRTVRLPDIKRKLFNRNAVAKDRTNNSVALGDAVTLEDTRLRGRTGTVKYIHMGALFLHARDVIENGGFLCVRARQCSVRGARSAPTAGAAVRNIAAMALLRSPAPSSGLGGFGAGASVLASPRMGGPPGMSGGGGGYGSFGSRGGQPGFSRRGGGGRDAGIPRGTKVTISKGPFRGYTGRVVSTTESHVRLELEAQYKTVTVRRDQLPVEQGGQPLPRPAPSYAGLPGSQTPGAATRTPLHVTATPMHAWGSATPLHPGAATPGRDNAWNPSAGPTPRHMPNYPDEPRSAPLQAGTPGGYGYGPSAGTPAYTPAYTPAETPAGTPGGADLGQLPGPPGGAYNAGTPAFLGAPTPYGDGATPALDGTTPSAGAGGAGGAYSPALQSPAAGTPGAAATPGTPGFDLESPGMPSGDEGQDWALWQGVVVQLPSGGLGVVQAAGADGLCTIAAAEAAPDGQLSVPPGARTIVQASAELARVPPAKKDAIKILAGEQRGQTGQLLGVDHSDGIVKLDANLDIKILALEHLARLHDPERPPDAA
ncbi:hypothetical protein WJX81_001276 [Elliptochloris bilobata]|uniref:Transcription elongation factor SPT5 n=1 Tax=Elliptochloris bilobata TaxID=381761 RepID=A0AAW1QHQ6_9CHLO